jgi:hypothetical protein
VELPISEAVPDSVMAKIPERFPRALVTAAHLFGPIRVVKYRSYKSQESVCFPPIFVWKTKRGLKILKVGTVCDTTRLGSAPGA